MTVDTSIDCVFCDGDAPDRAEDKWMTTKPFPHRSEYDLLIVARLRRNGMKVKEAFDCVVGRYETAVDRYHANGIFPELVAKHVAEEEHWRKGLS